MGTHSVGFPSTLATAAVCVGCISNCRSSGTNAAMTLAPNTLEMFSLVVGFPLVANTGVLFLAHQLHQPSLPTVAFKSHPFNGWLNTENLTPTQMLAYACSNPITLA